MPSIIMLIHKTGLAIALASFVVSNAYAQTGGTSGNNSSGPVTPHSYEGDLTGDAPHSDGPVVASDSDTLGDYPTDENECDTSGPDQ